MPGIVYPPLLASQRCFFNIYLNICCSFRFHFSSVTFEWFKLDGCLCIHFFPPHLIQRMKSFHAPNIAPPHLPGNQQRNATECVKEREGMTKRQKSRRKRKTFVKKIWIWNENMLEMNWNHNGLSGPNESLHERASKKCQSRCRTFHAPSPFSQASHNVANKTAHKKQYRIKSKENWARKRRKRSLSWCCCGIFGARCLACCPLWQMEMKGKHDSVNEWRTLLLTGDCFVLDAMWVRNLATSIENVDWPDWLPSSWLADCPAPGWLKMDLDEQTWNVDEERGSSGTGWMIALLAVLTD